MGSGPVVLSDSKLTQDRADRYCQANIGEKAMTQLEIALPLKQLVWRGL